MKTNTCYKLLFSIDLQQVYGLYLKNILEITAGFVIAGHISSSVCCYLLFVEYIL